MDKAISTTRFYVLGGSQRLMRLKLNGRLNNSNRPVNMGTSIEIIAIDGSAPSLKFEIDPTKFNRRLTLIIHNIFILTHISPEKMQTKDSKC